MSRPGRFLAAVSLILFVAGATELVASRAADRKSKPPAAPEAEAEAAPPRRSKRAPAPPLKDLRLTEEELAEDQIEQALSKPTDVNFLETSLEDVVGHLKELHKINIWIDRQALIDAKIAVDAPITLQLSGAQFESILNLLLDPLKLEWLIQDEVLKITSREKARESAATVTFDVQGLLDAGHTPDELIEAISWCIEPDSWLDYEAKTGYGTVKHSGGVLICRQTQRVLSSVAALLLDLEDLAEKQLEESSRPGAGPVVTLKVYHTEQFPAEELARALPELVARDEWDPDGVKTQFAAVKGALLVKQTPHVHREVDRVLKQLLPTEHASAHSSLPGSPEGPGAADEAVP